MFRNIYNIYLKSNLSISMLESIISFSSLYWIYYFIWICSPISTNSSNVVFSIKIAENLQKIFENNEIIETYNWLIIFDDKDRNFAWFSNRSHPNSWFWTSTLRLNSVNIRRRFIVLTTKDVFCIRRFVNNHSLLRFEHLSY